MGRTSSGLSVLDPENAVSRICLRLDRLASPGMQPSPAHDPNETMNCDLRRRSLARWIVSSVRMLPDTRVIVISPSAMASMSLYLPSMTVGHRTMSNALATSTMCSWMLTMAMSQPPHEAAPKMASFGLAAVGLVAGAAALDLAVGLAAGFIWLPPPPAGVRPHGSD